MYWLAGVYRSAARYATRQLDAYADAGCALHGKRVDASRYTQPRMKLSQRDRSRRIAVLFLCRHNAVRSQMAEALLRARFAERYEVVSAGSAPAGVHPLTLQVLEEIGVSTLGLRSKHVQEHIGRSFDIVVTVCGQDEPSCPFFPGGRQLHRAFADPSTVLGSQEELVTAFRRTRDEIDTWICEFFGASCGPV
jgi:arsenate reductase (thioredoxin)